LGDPQLFGSPDRPQDCPFRRGRSDRNQLMFEKVFEGSGSAEPRGLQKTTLPSPGPGSLYVADTSSRSSLVAEDCLGST